MQETVRGFVTVQGKISAEHPKQLADQRMQPHR